MSDRRVTSGFGSVIRDVQHWLGRYPTLNRLLGVTALVLVLYVLLMRTGPQARTPRNHEILALRFGLYGILTLGAGVLIISGGIDLSVGSVVGLSAVSLALLLENGYAPFVAALIVLVGAGGLGVIHGLLVTKMKLQPFLVTLCGLFFYRGLAQWLTRTPQGGMRDVGIGGIPDLEALKFMVSGRLLGVPMILWLMLALAALFAVLLHLSVYGRHLFAVGYNEQAARYAGVATDRAKILAYILCSLMAGLGGILELLDVGSASPSTAGSWYELYAITGAVLGGCSLRGGDGTVIGMILGAAVLPLLSTLCNFVGLNELQSAVIGVALLLGTILDEVLKRWTAARK